MDACGPRDDKRRLNEDEKEAPPCSADAQLPAARSSHRSMLQRSGLAADPHTRALDPIPEEHTSKNTGPTEIRSRLAGSDRPTRRPHAENQLATNLAKNQTHTRTLSSARTRRKRYPTLTPALSPSIGLDRRLPPRGSRYCYLENVAAFCPKV